MPVRSVLEKMGIKNEMKCIRISAVGEVPKELDMPDMKVSTRLVGEFDYIHLFAITQRDLDQQFPRVKAHLRKSGMLWVSWPKARQLSTDLDIKSVIRIGYDHDLVESKAISINETWSALKFTYPKEGKVYNNSYGKLKTKSNG